MKVKVTKTITVRANEVATVHYEEGFEGTAPSDHIERIVAAGCGERIEAVSSSPKDKGKA